MQWIEYLQKYLGGVRIIGKFNYWCGSLFQYVLYGLNVVCVPRYVLESRK